MPFHTLISTISDALTRPLPGLEAQLKMSSMRWIHGLIETMRHKNPIPSSVLLLLYPSEGEVFTVLMLRPDYGGIHSGQISLPGGRQEPVDPDLETTALRESQEEVGIIPENVRMLGRLSDLYIPPSRFLVTPFIGFSEARPDFVRDPTEVEEIIEINIRELFSEQAFQVKRHKVGMGVHIKAPAFVVNNHVIWGATAMILSEFNELIKADL